MSTTQQVTPRAVRVQRNGGIEGTVLRYGERRAGYHSPSGMSAHDIEPRKGEVAYCYSTGNVWVHSMWATGTPEAVLSYLERRGCKLTREDVANITHLS